MTFNNMLIIVINIHVFFIEDGFYVDSLLKVASSKKAKRLVRLELDWVGVPFYMTN